MGGSREQCEAAESNRGQRRKLGGSGGPWEAVHTNGRQWRSVGLILPRSSAPLVHAQMWQLCHQTGVVCPKPITLSLFMACPALDGGAGAQRWGFWHAFATSEVL